MGHEIFYRFKDFEDFTTALQIFVQTFVIFTSKVNIANSARKY